MRPDTSTGSRQGAGVEQEMYIRELTDAPIEQQREMDNSEYLYIYTGR